MGAVLLHANLWRWKASSDAVGALSLGVSMGDNDQASFFGYLFGLSAGFLDRKFCDRDGSRASMKLLPIDIV